MCGIAGLFNLDGAPADAAALDAMAGAMRHRGPDAGGVTLCGPAGFGHRRLSVIDLTGGAQPMQTPDGAFTIVFNGEIYNFLQLRNRLETQGIALRTRSDTEVLLHLYAAEGPAMLERLEGMFAFAVWDARRRELFLARDRLGKKPLFYFHDRARFAFASELHALRKAPGFPAAVRPEAVREFLTYQYIPCPRTIYRDVHKLPPGCWLRIAADAARPPEPQRYWQLCFSETAAFSLADSAAALRHRLEEAVGDRLIADVPLGAFLSGGVDSTCVAGLMARAMRQPVKTFTIGFSERAYDERRYARLAAETHGCDHRERVVNPMDFDAVRTLVRHVGEPYADASILPTFLLSRFTREHVTVALSGDGADELFGGYERYQALRLARLFDHLPAFLRRPRPAFTRGAAGERSFQTRLRRLLKLMHVPQEDRYLELLRHVEPDLQQELLGPRVRDAAATHDPDAYLDACFASASAPDPLARPAEVDVHSYLLNDILTKVDAASMAASLEVRSPFLDHRVVEFAATLPWAFKQTLFSRKRILLKACGDLIPPAIRRRRKKGFGVPLAHWFRAGWLPHLRDVLLDPATTARGFFAADVGERLIREHAAGEADHSYALWAMLMFDLWAAENSA